jgi:hypothetical protein
MWTPEIYMFVIPSERRMGFIPYECIIFQKNQTPYYEEKQIIFQTSVSGHEDSQTFSFWSSYKKNVTLETKL